MLNNRVATHREQISSREAALKAIDDCYTKLKDLESYFNVSGIKKPTQPYTNFRDSLFHFREICDAKGLLQINGNMYALEEHLSRSVKDYMVSLIIFLTSWLEHFFVTHDSRPDIQSIIDNDFAWMKKMSNWSIINFNTMLEKLCQQCTTLSVNESVIKQECFHYCIKTVQKHPEYIAELRHHLHIMKNHNLKLRSSSSILAKPYSNNTEFQHFCNDMNNFMAYTQKIKLQPCMYLLDYYHDTEE